MADAPTNNPAPDAATADAPQPSTDTLNDPGKKALQDERKAKRDAENRAKALEAELETLKQQHMSDTEKAIADRVKDATSPLQSENLRLRVALAKGVPAELVDRLQGSTQDEIEADADQLLALFKKQEDEQPEQVDPFPDLGQGARGETTPGLGSDALFKSLQNIVGGPRRRV